MSKAFGPSSEKYPDLITKWLTPKPARRQLDLFFVPKQAMSLPKPVATFFRKFLHINKLIDVFNSIPPTKTAHEFCVETLKTMQINLQVDSDLATTIPKKGPLIIVCNHPFGGIDGVALIAALLPLRPDLKVVVNSILGIFPDLRECCLPLDILSGNEALAVNTASLRMASSHLHDGGCVAFFPSGTVSHWQRGKGIVDPDWQMTAARLAKRFNATVLPLFFHGKNSMSFNIMGIVHPLVRTLLLPREFSNHLGSTVRLSCGRTIDPETFKILQSPESITAYLRMRCYTLAEKKIPEKTATPEPERPMEPVADFHDPNKIATAFAELPPENLLIEEGDFAVYCIRGGQSPLLLEELGSLREHTFRLVGEGSGKSRDLDIYDIKYYHLLLWNTKNQCLVGAYRLGKVQELLADGPESLYTTTLFSMTPEFFRRWGNALELGRAVVHPNYQREYHPLLMLWKGIGRFIVQQNDVHCLFGPVSLSLDYTPVSLSTVVEYFKTQCGSVELSTMVKGRTAPDKLLNSSKGQLPLPDTINYNGLVALVKDIEGGRGIPILFKHYLKLGGKIGAFHIDHSFNTLDAFLLMDLVHSPKNMLERYMSPEGTEQFLKKWK